MDSAHTHVVRLSLGKLSATDFLNIHIFHRYVIGVVRNSLGKLPVNLSQVVKRTKI